MNYHASPALRTTTSSTILSAIFKAIRRLFSTTSKIPPSLSKIPSRYRPQAIKQAQEAITEYLHSTRSLPFTYADHHRGNLQPGKHLYTKMGVIQLPKKKIKINLGSTEEVAIGAVWDIRAVRRTLDMLAARSTTSAAHFFSFQHSSISGAAFSAASRITQPPLLRHHFKPICSSASTHSQLSHKMTSSSARQFIEHIVLFKIKPEIDPSKVNSMLSNLNNLVSLDTVLHLSAGPIFRQRGSATLAFTHMLHSRYSNKPDLESYSKHPSHVSVVSDYVLPIVSDVMAVDWVADDVDGTVVPPAGSALRVTFTKLKEDAGVNEKEKILGVIGGIKDKFSGLDQLTCGENFSPARAKGFSIASIAVFKGVSELEALEKEPEKANAEKDKVRDLLDGVLVLDYVVPASQSASL